MTVRSFESFEELQETLRRDREAADARMTDQQKAIVAEQEADQYWVRPYPEAGVLIFGIAWGRRRCWDKSAEYAPDRDATGEEAEWDLIEVVDEMQGFYADREHNMLFGDCFSTLEPRGELGRTHASCVFPLSKEAFEEARAAGWKATEVPEDVRLIVGEKAARAAGWTPILNAELRALADG